MRLGLLGDVHAADEYLDRAIRHLLDLGVDRLLCVGDIVDGPGDIARCIDLLIEHDVLTVRGNHDRWVLTDQLRTLPGAHQREDLSSRVIEYLEALPPTTVIDTDEGPVLLSHGVGDDDMFFLTPWTGDYDLRMHDGLQEIVAGPVRWAVGGHTHQPMRRIIGETLFINPGPVCDARMDDDHGAPPSCARLDTARDTYEFWHLEDLSPFEP